MVIQCNNTLISNTTRFGGITNDSISKILKTILALSALVTMIFMFAACGKEDANAPAELKIHDSYAGVENIGDGKAILLMQGIITNNSELKTLDYADLPYLMMDDQKIDTAYEALDSSDTDKVAPGKSVVYEINYEFDPASDHEWGFGYSDDTVITGLEDYACIKEALRNFEGKPQVTMDDIKEMEKAQKEKFKEFEKSQK